MDFFYLPEWWVFLILGGLSFSLARVGHHGRGRKRSQIETIGGIGFVISIILGFVFTGWIGGIGLIIGFVIWHNISERLIFLLFRKYLMPEANKMSFERFVKRSEDYSARDYTIPTTVEEIMDHKNDQNEDREEEMLKVIAEKPEIKKKLEKYYKGPEEIKDIFLTFKIFGMEKYVGMEIITDPALLEEYLQMKKEGIHKRDIVFMIANKLGNP